MAAKSKSEALAPQPSAPKLRVGVLGCAGRMGRALVRTISAATDAEVVGGTEPPGSPWLGQDAGAPVGLPDLGCAIDADPRALFERADVVLDFTVPAVTALHAGLAAETGIAYVLGTTGTGAAEDQAVWTAAKHAVVVRAANMSLGVNVLLALARKAAGALDLDFDADVLEYHHKHKVDAPSGTALALGQAIAAARRQDHDKVATWTRRGQTGARKRGDIGYAVLRGGDVVGEHTVYFAVDGERIELTHRATNRDIFARGALAAARWTWGKTPGLYGMADVLGLGD